MTAVLSDQNFGSSTTQVEAALKKHEAIAADIEARVSPEDWLAAVLQLYGKLQVVLRLREIIDCPEMWNIGHPRLCEVRDPYLILWVESCYRALLLCMAA